MKDAAVTEKKRTPTRDLFDQLDVKLEALDAAKADLDKAQNALSRSQDAVNNARAGHDAALKAADEARAQLNSAVSGQTQPGVVQA